MYTIIEVAKMTNLSPHTLRFYAKKGLFPHVTRDKNNVRKFSSKDIEYVEVVKALRLTGMPLDEIQRYINLCEIGDETIHERYHIITKQQDRAQNYLAEIKDQIKLLDKKAHYYEEVIQSGDKNIVWNPNI